MMQHTVRKIPLLILSISFLLSACTGVPGTQAATLPVPTVTPDLFAAPSPTPFLPAGDVYIPPTPAPPMPPTNSPVPTIPPATATLTPMVSTPTWTLPSTIPLLPAMKPQYFITAHLDYSGHALSVGELIGYPNTSGVLLESLVLAVEPNLWSGGFLLDSLAVNGILSPFTLSAGRLEVPLTEPLAPGGSVTLGLNYRLVLPYAGTSNIYGYNSLQVNLLDWYPFVVPYDPSAGWLLHAPAAVGEHLVYDVADFDVTLVLDDPSLVVAAGAPAEWTDSGWHYRLTGRTFAMSISDAYQTASTGAGDMIVTSYFFSGEEAAAAAMLDEVAKAMLTYSDHFGPAPCATLSIVEAAAYGDGMEADGLFFLGRKYYQAYTGSVQSDVVALGVHEAAHNWWFGSVGSDQALEPWLDEALAIYSEHIFYEVHYPGLVNWWWNFRVNHYSPSGWVDNTIYNAGPFRSYVNSVYLRGADFLDALRIRIGDEAFLAFLKDYATQMAGQRATSEDFFRILRQHTGTDFTDITNSFFQVPR